MTANHPESEIQNAKTIEDARPVALLAKLVRAFKARKIELSFDEQDTAILRKLAEEGLIDLRNDGFQLTETTGTYVAKSQIPPVTPLGILFLERLPVDKFIDQPGLFRFLGWL